MLSLTKKTGYGLIAMTHLAGLPDGEVACSREIAEKFGVPASLLMNVLKELSAAGYVTSVRGARGGYRLAQRPEKINLAQLITTLEGPIRLAECLRGEGNGTGVICELMERCPIVDPVHRVQRKFKDFLETITLADIAEPAFSKPPG